MITKLIQRIFRRSPRHKVTQSPAARAPKRISKKSHRIDPQLLSKNAVKVTHTLQQAGYQAYIVGGAVRDLALGIGPKDFDVATSATPDQVRSLFRRRLRLAVMIKSVIFIFF